MQCRIAPLLAAFLMTSVIASMADEPAAPKGELSVGEKELIQLVAEMKAFRSEWYQQFERIVDEETQLNFFYEKARSEIPFVDQFIAFERKHRGSHLGLMAARQLWHMVRGTAALPGAPQEGAKHVLETLGEYGEFDELSEILKFLDGCPLPKTESALSALLADGRVSENNRSFAKLTLARWIIAQRNYREITPKYLEQIEAKKITVPLLTRNYDSKRLELCVPQERVPELEREAKVLLKSLCETAGSATEHATKASDENDIIIHANKDKPGNLVRDLADGILFKEQHLRPGQPAPDLKVKLLDGSEFSLTAQQGKTVIVQFCFTGCGPCEVSYPKLRELAQQYPDKLEILTIMRDETDEDAKAAVASGKMTWKVCVDGKPGPVTTRWGIDGFPMLYLFDPDAKMASKDDIADPDLRKKICEL